MAANLAGLFVAFTLGELLLQAATLKKPPKTPQGGAYRLAVLLREFFRFLVTPSPATPATVTAASAAARPAFFAGPRLVNG